MATRSLCQQSLKVAFSLLLCWLWLSSSLQAAELYVASPQGLFPVARYLPQTQSFSAPSSDPVVAKALLEDIRELPLYLNGEIQDYFRPQQFVEPSKQCSGYGAWRGSSEKRHKYPLLAFSSDFSGVRQYLGNYPTSQFNQVALQHSRQAYQRHGRKPDELKRLKAIRIQPFTLENGTRLLVAVESLIQTPGKSCPEFTLLLLLEKVGRRYVTRLERYRHNQKSCAGYRFVSSFATDNSIDNLLIQGQMEGASWYDIFQARKSGALEQVFHGGGHKCPLLLP